jgi:hypothetical protein
LKAVCDHSIAAITPVRVKVIGNAEESPEALRAAVKRRFAKTHAFYGALPRFDDGLPYVGHDSVRDVTHLSNDREPAQREQVPPVARPDATPAQAHKELHKSADNELAETRLSHSDTADRTTLRVKALKPLRAAHAHRLWQRQTPLLAFALAASFCILCLLAVNLLTP